MHSIAHAHTAHKLYRYLILYVTTNILILMKKKTSQTLIKVGFSVQTLRTIRKHSISTFGSSKHHLDI